MNLADYATGRGDRNLKWSGRCAASGRAAARVRASGARSTTLGATRDFPHRLLEPEQPVDLDDEAAVTQVRDPIGA